MRLIVTISALLSAWFATNALGLQQPQQEAQGIEVLTRGPVHEAFAEPESLDPRPGPIIPKKPPDPIEELPPDEKPVGDNVVWIPGYFGWDDELVDFIWISGAWRQEPPGRDWMPGHWCEVDGGWQWTPGYWASEAQTDVEYLPPPPPTLEAGPTVEAPNPNSIYVPGCWVFHERRYMWRPGHWIAARLGWVYVPACYEWTPAGCIFTEGHWDYPLERRGLLFAPIRLAGEFWQRPGWYRPNHVVSPEFLLDSLFVRPDFHRYYFGDYYAAGYARHGFVPWFNYHVAKNTPAPFYSYYRWQHRKEDWDKQVHQTFEARQRNEAPRPPRTLVEQQQMIKNVTVNNTIQVGDKTFKVKDAPAMIRTITAAQPIAKLEHPNIKVEAVPRAKQEAVRKTVLEIHKVSKARHEIEDKPAKKEVQVKEPVRAKIELPKPAAPRAKIETPPPPPPPKQVERPLPKHEPVKPIVVPHTPLPLDKGKPPEKKEEHKGPKDKKDKGTETRNSQVRDQESVVAYLESGVRNQRLRLGSRLGL